MDFQISDKVLQRVKHQIHGRLVGNTEQEIEDVISQAYVRLVESLQHFKGECSIETYAYSIVNFTIVDYIRNKYTKEQQETMSIEELTIEPRYYDNFEKRFEDEEEFNNKLDKLTNLTNKQKGVIRLVVFNNMPHEEAGQVLGISRKAVSGHMELIREKFSKKKIQSKKIPSGMVEVRYFKRGRLYKIEYLPRKEVFKWVDKK